MTARVYVGGYNSLCAMARYTREWDFVRANAEGLFVNNFAFREFKKTGENADTVLGDIAAKMSSKRAIYETDVVFPVDWTLEDDKESLMILKEHFAVEWIAVNRGAGGNHDHHAHDVFEVPTLERLELKQYDSLQTGLKDEWADLKFITIIPPWGFKTGDIGNDYSKNWRNLVRYGQGIGTDGAMDAWITSFPKGHYGMRRNAETLGVGGSSGCVRWWHGERGHNRDFWKMSMIMVAPVHYAGPEFLRFAKDCAAIHGLDDARPDVWVVSNYGPANQKRIRTMPETAGGADAETVMGAARWLIQNAETISGKSALPDSASWPEYDPRVVDDPVQCE